MTDLAPLLPAVPVTWSHELRVAGLVVGGQRSKNTQDAYRRDLVAFFEWCLGWGLAPLALRKEHIDQWVRDLETHLSHATINRRLSVVSQFYDEAIAEEVIGRSPTARVKRFRVDRDQQLGIDAHQARALLRVAAASGPRDEALVCLLLLNGLRVSEACSLRVRDFGRAGGYPTMTVSGKGGKVSRVRLAARTADAIRRHLASHPGQDGSAPLFARAENEPMSRFDVARVTRRLGRQAGIPTGMRNPHELRHTFVTLALAAGVPLNRVRKGARHVDPKTTAGYEREMDDLSEHATIRLTQWLEEDGRVGL